jgi:hypothetical protein
MKLLVFLSILSIWILPTDHAPSKKKLQVVQFKSKRPFQSIREDGRIGPWAVDWIYGRQFFTIDDFDIVIKQSGLYDLYAQVLFVTDEDRASFTIQYSRNHTITTIAHCATIGTGESDESADVSCYTHAIHALEKGDQVIINIVEQNRYINTEPMNTFLGLSLIQATETYRPTQD